MNWKPTRYFCNGLCLLLLICGGWIEVAWAAEPGIGVQKLIVNGQTVAMSSGKPTKLPPQPGTVAFIYGPTDSNYSGHAPLRIRYKLEGFDSDWQEKADPASPHLMRVMIVFFNTNLSQVQRLEFPVIRQSPGWTGNFQTSTLQHRRETMVMPPEASSFQVTIISAGSPQTLGAYVVSDFVAQLQGLTNNPPQNLLEFSFDRGKQTDNPEAGPQGWERGGTRPAMARIAKIGAGLPKKALALVDNDPNGHAQWSTGRIQVPTLKSGDHLLIEWDEMFSIGPGSPDTATYENLPPGFYRFNLNALTIMGQPTVAEYSVGIEVPLPFWRTSWFWTTDAILVVGLFLVSWRYRAVRHLRAENLRLEQQQTLERERFRIARDIHDDLGARVTQISLASALAERNTADAAAETNFRNITQMAREMVVSLYDTLWVVNPENDNLEAVGNYLCQMVNQLSSQAGLRCRLEVPPLPADVSISSHQRHNLNLAVKEAMHNTIKHAAASEVRMKMTLNKSELIVAMQDDGRGFELKTGKDGNGLANMKHRLADIGGSAEVSSAAGQGTTVLLRMPFQRTNHVLPTKAQKSA